MTGPRFVVWFRSGRGRWRAVGEATNYAGAVALIDNRGLRSADWLIRDNDRDPNQDVPPWRADRQASAV